MKKQITALLALSFLAAGIFAQSHTSSQSHLSEITSISEISGDGSIFTTGNDGFVIKWANNEGDHYQLTDSQIKIIARNPSNNNEIAIYETDGSSFHRVTVWNWTTYTKRYGFLFNSSITSLSYSSKGTYLICGSTSENGTYFINNASGNLVNAKIKENTGVVSMAVTSPSEKNVAMYSPTGSLSYYNLKTGVKSEKLSVEKNLSQGTMFNNFVFFAGVRDRILYVYDARLGSVIGRFNVSNPVLIKNDSSPDLYYVESSNRQIKLYKVANDRNKAVIQPQLVCTVSGLNQNETVTTASIYGNEIIAGTSTGNVYKFNSTATERVEVITAMSEKMYDKISDIASVGNDFYFLTPKDLFLSSYDRGEVDRKGSSYGHTNLLTYGNDVVLWSKNTAKTVQLLKVADGTISNLFTPSNKIESLKIFGNTIIEIQGNTTVNCYNISTNKYDQLYMGSGIQDAVLYNETDLYVAKSNTSSPQVPLIYVNTNTKETVPLSLKGTVAYALNFDTNQPDSDIYGIIIGQNAQNKTTTSIFAFTPSTKSFRTMTTEAGGYTDAFTTLHMPIIYTNTGKTLVQSFNIETNRKFTYKRSASLPVKMARNSNRLVILNRDGSISWYDPETSLVLHDWYLTTDGQWFEF